MNPEIEKELREWLRPMSPLTAFAKSIRNEGTAANPNPPQLFDFDFAELPTDIREKLEATKKEVEKIQGDLKTTEDRRKQAEDFARKQQSEASKAKGRLAAHNIPLDGPANPSGPVSADTKLQARVDRFVKDGLPEPQARAYAKMLDDEAKQQREDILKEFGPLVNQVGTLQASGALLEARSKFPDVFKVPALDKEITDAANYMLTQGNVPTFAAIQSLVQMAWGKAIMDDPTLLKDKKGADLNTQQHIPNMSSTIRTGGHTPPIENPNDPKAPVATQPETSAIMANVIAEMNKGIPSAKKK